MKFVSIYDVAPTALPKLKEHFAAHRARLEEFQAAEDFIKGDPFVINGLVTWRVLEWNAAFF